MRLSDAVLEEIKKRSELFFVRNTKYKLLESALRLVQVKRSMSSLSFFAKLIFGGVCPPYNKKENT